MIKDDGIFCMAPWTHLHFWPNGTALPCCMTNQSVGNTNHQSIAEIWNGDHMRQLRRNMLSSTPSSACQRCYDLEKSNVYTLRRSMNADYQHHWPKVQDTLPDGTAGTPLMAYVDVRFSNICNLRCRTCSHDLSSGWYDETVARWPQYDRPRISNINASGDFWTQLLPLLDHTEEAHFAGGESLITDEHYRMLDHWIAQGRTDIRLRYTTNFTVLDYKKRDLFELWRQFPDLRVAASLDGSGARGEYLRKNMLWSDVVANRQRMLRELPDTYFEITPTVSLMNILHLPDFHREWVESGLIGVDNLRLNLLSWPAHSSVQVLPRRIKALAQQRIEDHLSWLHTQGARSRICDDWQGIVDFMWAEDRTDLLAEFVKETLTVDAQRHESFWTVFPELQALQQRDTFCSLPWRNLNTTPMGQCKLCCNITDFKVLYAEGAERHGQAQRALNWAKDQMDTIWNGAHMQDVRHKMLSGQQVDDCGECYDIEAAGQQSPRQAALRDWPMDPRGITPVTDTLPQSLELRLSTRCNLRCLTCWSGSSDQIAAERMAHRSDPTVPEWLRKEWAIDININLENDRGFDSDPDYVGRDQSMQNFLQLAPTLTKLYITGGEPTMDANIYRYLDALADCGNTACHVSFTTNCTLWNPKLMAALSRFAHNEVQLSIDGHEAVGEFIRYPTKWSDVHANVQRYLSSPSIHSVRVFTVFSALNAHELLPMLRYIINTANRLGKTVVWWPIQLSFQRYQRVQVLQEQHRWQIAEQLTEGLADQSQWHETHCHYREGLAQVLAALAEPCDTQASADRRRLAQHLDTMDRLRGTQWRQSLPQLGAVL